MGMAHPTLTSSPNTQINPLIMKIDYKNNSKTQWNYTPSIDKYSQHTDKSSHHDTKVQEQSKN